MNPRLKQITGQVLDEVVPETWTALKYDKIKEIQLRTAELIIQECIETLSTHEDYWTHEQSMTQLKKHFGFE